MWGRSWQPTKRSSRSYAKIWVILSWALLFSYLDRKEAISVGNHARVAQKDTDLTCLLKVAKKMITKACYAQALLNITTTALTPISSAQEPIAEMIAAEPLFYWLLLLTANRYSSPSVLCLVNFCRRTYNFGSIFNHEGVTYTSILKLGALWSRFLAAFLFKQSFDPSKLSVVIIWEEG